MKPRYTGPLRVALLSATLFGIGSCGSSASVTGPPEGELNVLFVGNSLTYTNDLPGLLAHLLRTQGGVQSVHVEAVAFPNFGLEDHWAQGTARARIAQGGWHFVIVQQGPSASEGRPSLIEYSARFADELGQTGARLAVYMVWPSRARAFDFDGVSDSHRVAAQQAGGLLFPAGEAWRAAWARAPDLPLYGPDGFHPSLLGTYLAALVMFEQISGVSPSALPEGLVTPSGTVALPPGTSEILHDAAAEANREFALGAGASGFPAPARTGEAPVSYPR